MRHRRVHAIINERPPHETTETLLVRKLLLLLTCYVPAGEMNINGGGDGVWGTPGNSINWEEMDEMDTFLFERLLCGEN